MAFEKMTSTYVDPFEDEDEIEEEEEKETKPKKKKRGLAFKRVAVPAAIAVGIPAIAIGSCNAKKATKEHEEAASAQRIEAMVGNDQVNTSNFLNLVDEKSTSLDELLNGDLEDYQAYENYRILLNAQRQVITPKMDNLKNYDYQEVSYDSLSKEYLEELNNEYYYYYNLAIDYSAKGDTDNYNANMAEFNNVCVRLISADKAINAYREKYGHDLVCDMASIVLASKAIDSESNYNINPNTVTEIASKTTNKDINITFDFNDAGKQGKIDTDYSTDNELIKRLKEDIASNTAMGDLDAIHTTKAIILYFNDPVDTNIKAR